MELGYFKVAEGLELAQRIWKQEQAKANILLCHGYAEHSGRYEYEASFFNERGYSVYGYDHRGHGKSKGERAYVNSFEEYLDDLKVYLDLHRDELVSKPLILFGHSMGGLIWVSYLLNRNYDLPTFKGIVLSAPALKIHRDISPFLQKISGIISVLFPRLQTVPLDNTVLSHDPAVYEDHVKDDLNYKGKAKARLGGEMIKTMKSLKPKFKDFKHPFVIFHGEDDQHAEIEGSKIMFDLSESADKKLVKLEGMYHEITKELGKEKVLKGMVDWMDEHIDQ